MGGVVAMALRAVLLLLILTVGIVSSEQDILDVMSNAVITSEEPFISMLDAAVSASSSSSSDVVDMVVSTPTHLASSGYSGEEDDSTPAGDSTPSGDSIATGGSVAEGELVGDSNGDKLSVTHSHSVAAQGVSSLVLETPSEEAAHGALSAAESGKSYSGLEGASTPTAEPHGGEELDGPTEELVEYELNEQGTAQEEGAQEEGAQEHSLDVENGALEDDLEEYVDWACQKSAVAEEQSFELKGTMLRVNSDGSLVFYHNGMWMYGLVDGSIDPLRGVVTMLECTSERCVAWLEDHLFESANGVRWMPVRDVTGSLKVACENAISGEVAVETSEGRWRSSALKMWSRVHSYDPSVVSIVVEQLAQNGGNGGTAVAYGQIFPWSMKLHVEVLWIASSSVIGAVLLSISLGFLYMFLKYDRSVWIESVREDIRDLSNSSPVFIDTASDVELSGGEDDVILGFELPASENDDLIDDDDL